MLAVVAIGKHTTNWADQEGRQHTDDEQPPDGEARTRQLPNKCSGGDQVEPVAEQTDDLAQPQVAEAGVASRQLQVPYGRRDRTRIFRHIWLVRWGMCM